MSDWPFNCPAESERVILAKPHHWSESGRHDE